MEKKKNFENKENPKKKCLDFEKCYKSQQRTPLREDMNNSGGYPVEDPRNPYHEEYLKLKRKFDGYRIDDDRSPLRERTLGNRGLVSSRY